MVGPGPSGSARLAFRPLTAADLPLLTQWLSAPHVARWWDGAHDVEAVRRCYMPRIQGVEAVNCFIASSDGVAAGLFQHYTWDEDPELAMSVGAAPTDAGLDFLIGIAAFTGQGLGPQMLEAFIEQEVLINPLTTGLRVGVDGENVNSWRTLEKIGFRREAGRGYQHGGRSNVVYVHPR